MVEKKVCCICGKRFKGYGHDPDPIKKEGRCCDECNLKVIEEREKELSGLKLWLM